MGSEMCIRDSLGIVSRGFGCSRYNEPGIYTRVKEYIFWIRNVIKSEELDIKMVSKVNG